MSAEAEAAITLLHVSAIVSALTLAYVGVDHSRIGADDDGQDAAEAAEADAKERLTQLGLTDGVPVSEYRRFDELDTLCPVYAMCVIARQQRQLFPKKPR